jgi:hypothetical protein
MFLPLNPDPGSGFPIRIRIHKVAESGSNPETDPQPCLKLLVVDSELDWIQIQPKVTFFYMLKFLKIVTSPFNTK